MRHVRVRVRVHVCVCVCNRLVRACVSACVRVRACAVVRVRVCVVCALHKAKRERIFLLFKLANSSNTKGSVVLGRQRGL